MGRCGTFAAGILSATQTLISVKLIQPNGLALEQHRNTVVDRIHDLAIFGNQRLVETFGQFGAVAVNEFARIDRRIDFLQELGPRKAQAFVCHGTAEN